MSKRKAVHESSEYTCKLGEMGLRFRHMSLRERDVFLGTTGLLLNKRLAKLNDEYYALMDIEGDQDIPDSKVLHSKVAKFHEEVMAIVDLVGLGDTAEQCRKMDQLAHIPIWYVVLVRMFQCEVSLANNLEVPKQDPIPGIEEVDNLSNEETESLGKDSPPKHTAKTSSRSSVPAATS